MILRGRRLFIVGLANLAVLEERVDDYFGFGKPVSLTRGLGRKESHVPADAKEVVLVYNSRELISPRQDRKREICLLR